jgi:hypothetical protein
MSGAELPINPGMTQHPKVTVVWAVESLEKAISMLPDGLTERRVRKQFHQLLLALNRDEFPVAIDAKSPCARLSYTTQPNGDPETSAVLSTCESSSE